MDSDQLLSLRNAFYSGNHSLVVSEASDLFGADGKVAVMRDVFLYRSMMEVGEYEKVFNSISQTAAMGLLGVKLHATFKQATDDANRETVLEQAREWLSDADIARDEIFCWVVAQVLYEAQDYKEALRLVHAGESLEMRALTAQIFLKLDRIDLAEKQIVKMQETDDDDILTALCVAWVSLAKGGDAVHTAVEMVNELVEKFSNTVYLMNLLALCQIKLTNYADAFNMLRRARELSKESNQKVSADTLINSIVCVQHLNKGALVPKVLGELQSLYPNHAYFAATAAIEAQFDKAAAERS